MPDPTLALEQDHVADDFAHREVGVPFTERGPDHVHNLEDVARRLGEDPGDLVGTLLVVKEDLVHPARQVAHLETVAGQNHRHRQVADLAQGVDVVGQPAAQVIDVIVVDVGVGGDVLEDVVVGEEDPALLVEEGDQTLGVAWAFDDLQAATAGHNDVALLNEAIAADRLRHHQDVPDPLLVDLEEVVGDAEGAARATQEVAAANGHTLPVGHERPIDPRADHLAADPVLDGGAEPEMVDVSVAEDQLLDRVGFGARAPDELKQVVNREVEAGAGVEQRYRVAQAQ